ncbi:helix-turn-helix domain-containing protein [Winogradskyella sp.]|nr:helix-turn-helix domain-containing protein [Winogradskyella sp.]
MRIFYIISALIFTIGPISQAQVPNDKYLEIVDYEELLTLFNVYEGDSLVQKKIIDIYLSRAKEDNDTIKIARSFDRLARIFSSKKNISYADSLIDYTRDWKHITYPAIGYIIQGYEFGKINDIRSQNNSFYTAFQLAKTNQNYSQQLYLLDMLIFLRTTWGDINNAILLQDERHSILDGDSILSQLKNSTRKGLHSEINSIYNENLLSSYKSYVHCFVKLKDYQSALKYVDTISEFIKDYDSPLNHEEQEVWVQDARIEIDYYLGNYLTLNNRFTETTQAFDLDAYPRFKGNIYLFLGLAALDQNNYGKSLEYLLIANKEKKNLDSYMFDEYDKLLYNGLSQIYNIEGNYSQSLFYIEKLLKLDSLSIINYKFLEPKYINMFETPRLIKSKEDIIKALQLRNTRSYVVIGISVFLFLFFSALSYYFFRQKVTYRRRFEKLMKDDNSHIANNSKSLNNEAPIIISNDIVTDILKRLKRFEDNEDFLKDNVTLIALAKKMHTNSSYLSRVVNSHKLKSFSQYLNDLRVQYAVSKIKSDHVFRRYTVEAIASECGYNTAASFSRSFYKKTGIYPSFMIAEVNKQGEN